MDLNHSFKNQIYGGRVGGLLSKGNTVYVIVIKSKRNIQNFKMQVFTYDIKMEYIPCVLTRWQY